MIGAPLNGYPSSLTLALCEVCTSIARCVEKKGQTRILGTAQCKNFPCFSFSNRSGVGIGPSGFQLGETEIKWDRTMGWACGY